MKHLIILMVMLLGMTTMSMRCVSNGESAKGGGTFTGTVLGQTFEIGWTWRISRTSTGQSELTIGNPFINTGEGCVIFKDANGNIIEIVPVQIPPGGSVTIPQPPGATTHYAANGADCTRSRRGLVGGVMEGLLTQISPPELIPRFHLSGLSVVDLSGAPNLESRITADRADAAAFSRTVEDILEFGYQTDLNVRPGVVGLDAYLTEAIYHSGNDLELTIASNGTFTDIEVWVNGVMISGFDVAYRPAVVGAGWDAWSFYLPAGVFNYDGTSGASWSNNVEFRFNKAGDPADYNLQRSMGFISE